MLVAQGHLSIEIFAEREAHFCRVSGWITARSAPYCDGAADR
jgi:hypothetical protein